MNLFKRYLNYLKDNPEGYWFKRKIYGWGWVPVKWQGWLTVFVFIAFILWSGADMASSNPEPNGQDLTWFFGKIIVAVVALIWICYKKGEKPRWQWGLPKEDSGNRNKS